MNNKGQGFNVIIIAFMAIIIGVILLVVSAQNVGESTNTFEVANTSFAAANNTLYTFTDYKALSDVVIYNNTADVIIGVGNYTVTNNVITNGALTTTVAVNYSSAVYAGGGWNISGTAEPLTYINSAGGRSMATLIILFFALAIAMVAMYPIYEGKLLQLIGK